MHELNTQEELSRFWGYASRRPDVWPSLLKGRVEHTSLGRGTIVEVSPRLGDDGGPKAYVRVLFDAPRVSRKGKAARSKVLRLPFVLDKKLLKRMAVPRAAVPASLARPSAGRAAQSPPASARRGDAQPPMPRKKDWRKFQELVEKHRILWLYHFTDVRNLDSIKRHGGLLSWWRCRQRGIVIPAPGGNPGSQRMDEAHGLQDYVRLGFNTSLPMMHVARREGRIRDARILRVDPSVIYLETTRFSDVNANDRDARLGLDIEAFERIAFGLATGRRWEGQEEKRLFQAEVLVKGHVPLDLIRSL